MIREARTSLYRVIAIPEYVQGLGRGTRASLTHGPATFGASGARGAIIHQVDGVIGNCAAGARPRNPVTAILSSQESVRLREEPADRAHGRGTGVRGTFVVRIPVRSHDPATRETKLREGTPGKSERVTAPRE